MRRSSPATRRSPRHQATAHESKRLSEVLPLQSLDFPTQSLAFTLELLALGVLRPFAPLVDPTRELTIGVRHTEVMPEARNKYKYEILDRARSASARVRTR